MPDRRWDDARRLEAWAGETRVNLIRAVGLAVFYGYHLVNVFLLSNDPALRGRYNLKVTCVVLAWGLAAGALHLCLSRRFVPPALPYVAVFWDLAMISTLLLVDKAAGPHSPLIVLYLVVASSPLRISLRLVYAATLGAMAAATLMMGGYVFVLVGATEYYAANSPYAVPRSSEVVFLLALGAAGLLAGQAVRQARRLVRGYPVTVEEKSEAA